MNLTIYGDTPSKKNSRRAIYVGGRTIMIANKRYDQWHKDSLRQVTRGSKMPYKACSVKIWIFPMSARKSDLSNKAESIMDLLVDAGVLEDDNWFVVPSLTLQFGEVDKENPRAEVEISCYDKVS